MFIFNTDSFIPKDTVPSTNNHYPQQQSLSIDPDQFATSNTLDLLTPAIIATIHQQLLSINFGNRQQSLS